MLSKSGCLIVNKMGYQLVLTLKSTQFFSISCIVIYYVYRLEIDRDRCTVVHQSEIDHNVKIIFFFFVFL